MSCTVNLAECRSLTDDALIAISSGEMALHHNRCATQTHTHTRTESDALSVHCRAAWLGRHVCLCLLEAHQSRPGWPWQCAITSQAILPRWSLQSTSLLTNSAITIAKLTYRFGACTDYKRRSSLPVVTEPKPQNLQQPERLSRQPRAHTRARVVMKGVACFETATTTKDDRQHTHNC